MRLWRCDVLSGNDGGDDDGMCVAAMPLMVYATRLAAIPMMVGRFLLCVCICSNNLQKCESSDTGFLTKMKTTEDYLRGEEAPELAPTDCRSGTTIRNSGASSGGPQLGGRVSANTVTTRARRTLWRHRTCTAVTVRLATSALLSRKLTCRWQRFRD